MKTLFVNNEQFLFGKMIVSLENVTKYFGDKNVLVDINVSLQEGDKIGVIGPNGAGKTTLVKMICRSLQPDEGQVMLAGGKRIGFLQQNSGLIGANSILEEMHRAFVDLFEAREEMTLLEEKMGAAMGVELEKINRRYAKLSTYFEQRDGYNIDVQIKRVLNGMGFGEKQLSDLVGNLSGGEKTRLALAKLLLEQPDLLILDEPTNHLDFASIEWLEEYLSQYKKAILIVSHDRYFLDRVVSGIWEIEQTHLTSFKGNYSKYLVLKEERVERQLKEYEQQQQKIAALQEFVDKNIVRASTTKRAQSRQKELERMERIEKPNLHRKTAKISFSFERETGNDVLEVDKLLLQVDELILGRDISFSLRRGDKLGIIGVNGAGKSTLLKTLNGSLPPKSGRILWGKNVVRGYYDQEHLSLDGEKSVLGELWDRFPGLAEQQVRNTLGAVGLTGDNVLKQVKVLSGGEKAKLLFAILMLTHPNVMLLDEPTNHLDLYTKESLEKALMEYSGTILVVSHDRYFLNRVPDRIGQLDRRVFRVFPGNYDAFGERMKKEKAAPPKPVEGKQEKAFRSKEEKKQQAQRRQRSGEVEKRIAALEQENAGLEGEIASPEVAANYQLLQEKCDALERNKEELEELYLEWAELND